MAGGMASSALTAAVSYGEDLCIPRGAAVLHGTTSSTPSAGKSTLLTMLGKREVPIPEHIDIYHLDREVEASDMTALEAVMAVDEEKTRLEAEAERLSQLDQADPEVEQRLMDVYDR